MAQYQVEALRTIRAIQRSHEKAGHTFFAEQMKRIGDQVEAMQAELYDWQERANEHANNSATATTELIGLRAELDALKDEIAQRQDTEASLTKWVHDLGEELAALREAVAWERETYVFWEFGRTYTLVANDEALESMFAARAEVDRLIASEGAANCKGEG